MSCRTLSPSKSAPEETLPRQARSTSLQLSMQDTNPRSRGSIFRPCLTSEYSPYLMPFPRELSGFDPVSPPCNYSTGKTSGMPISCQSPFYSSESCYSTVSETPLAAVSAQPLIPFGCIESSQPSPAESHVLPQAMFIPEQFRIPQVPHAWNEYDYPTSSSSGIHENYLGSFISAVGIPPPSVGSMALSLIRT